MTAPPPIPSADAHPPAPDDDAIFEYDGITYRVSELMAFDPRDTQPSGIPTARVARTARAATAWRRAQRTAEAATVKILLSADVIYELLAAIPTPLGAGGLTRAARDRLTEAGVVLRALQLRTPNLGWALDRLIRAGRVVALPGSQAVARAGRPRPSTPPGPPGAGNGSTWPTSILAVSTARPTSGAKRRPLSRFA